MSSVAAAQTAAVTSPTASATEAAPTQEPKRDKNVRFSILGGPFYNQQVQFAIGAAPLITFSTNPSDPQQQRSTVTFPFSASTNGSFAIAVAGRIFYPGDRRRETIGVVLRTGPDQYWGRGFDSGDDPDNEEGYDRTETRLLYISEWRAKGNLFLGGGFNLSNFVTWNYAAGGNIASETTPPNVLNSGFVGVVSYDSRDVVSNAYRGMLLEVDGRVYRGWMGSDLDYERYRFDYRGYHKISPTRDFILAWQFVTERAGGDVPWQELPAVGSPNAMRAYFRSRFRDNWTVIGQVELRLFELFRRHGLAVWAGAATVSPRLADARIDEALYEIGIGYRFRLQPRQNARIDFAVGRDSMGFSLQVLEAF